MDKKFASRTEVASILDIHRMTFSNYCTGKRRVTDVGIRKKLFDLTGIDVFKSDKPDEQDSVLLTTWADLYIETPSNRKNDHKIIVTDSKTSVECAITHADSQKCNTTIAPRKEDLKVFTDGNNVLGGVSRPFIDIASSLRNWFNSQHIWTSQKEIAENIGVSYSSMKRIFQGRTKPEVAVKHKLYEITQLECFRDEQHEKDTCVKEVDDVCPDKEQLCVDKGSSDVNEVETSVGNSFQSVTTDLRKWFNNQNTWKTPKEIAEHIGISNSSLKKMLQGKKKPEGIVKQKLYEITQLECFRDDQQAKSTHVEKEDVVAEEDSISIEETNVCKEEGNTCVDKASLPIYEVKTSVDKKNGYTKKMKIPIHEVKTYFVAINGSSLETQENVSEIPEHVVEVSEPVAEVSEPVAEVSEPVAEIQEFVDGVQKLLEEVKVLVAEVQDPISEVQEPVAEVQEHIPEIQEPVQEIQEPVQEIQEPVQEIPEHIPEIPEHIPEIQEPVQEIPEHIPEIPEHIPEIQEPIPEVQGHIPEIQEPVQEIPDPISAAQEPVVTVQDPISAVKEPVAEIQRRAVEVQSHTRELISGELDKNCNVESLRNIVSYIEDLEQEIKILKSNKKNGNKKSAGDEVEKLATAFYSLAKVLKSFKNCTSEQRKKVKNRINAQDFGYVTSFMKAMYDEQNFTDFMFFADYELKGDEK